MRFVEQHGLTILELPTAYWHEITGELASESRPLPSSLRVVIVGGEKARADEAARWHAITGGRGGLDQRLWTNRDNGHGDRLRPAPSTVAAGG